ncbi:alpha/beta-hydrolase [Thozetella sp. PMI_491]|nr:alpha/beta-hydrolase [Thozetella sp. PMI_491]
MYFHQKKLAIFSLFAAASASDTPLAKCDNAHDNFNLRPFTIDLADRVPRMRELVTNSQLPVADELAYPGPDAGISASTLESLRTEWLDQFDWGREQATLNQFPHFTTIIENLTIHFIHIKSTEPDAIPLLLAHGWPGTFIEFLPVLDNLTQAASTSTGKPVAFDVIVPSLPGFAFSSAPPPNWSTDDTARVFNTLMTQLLGYEKYAVFGTDFGGFVSYRLYDSFNSTVRAAHFTLVPFAQLSAEQLAAEGITLSPLEQYEAEYAQNFSATGFGYFMEQATKPNTIGLALQDNPVGQLAYLGEKLIAWSEPQAGTPPSVFTHNEMLCLISLYFLTRTFLSSVYIYFQNPEGFRTTYTKARTDAPMLFSAFRHDAFYHRSVVEQVGNLVFYRNHDFGGHFAGLDNPSALIDDLREIGNYWMN